MRITNYHHIEAPLLPPDDSEVIAAEAEYILNSIGEALLSLNDAKTAAGGENVWKAKQCIQMALDTLSELVGD